MLIPKRVKHRKDHRGKMKGRAKGGTEVAFRRIRPAGARAGMDHEPSDRGSADCDDSLHQAGR